MVDAICETGGQVWHLLAKDEGHGFRKKENADYYFHSVISFFIRFLWGDH